MTLWSCAPCTVPNWGSGAWALKPRSKVKPETAHSDECGLWTDVCGVVVRSLDFQSFEAFCSQLRIVLSSENMGNLSLSCARISLSSTEAVSS